MSACAGTPLSGVPIRAPSARRICAFTRSTPVTISVTVCSTWMRGLTSMKKKSPAVDVLEELHGARVAVARLARQPHGGVRRARRGRRGRAPRRARAPPPSGGGAARCSRARRGAPPAPASSPRICTSRWRARSTRRSRKTSSRPNAAPRLAPRGGHLLDELARVRHHAHAASAAAPARLDHQREAHLRAEALDLAVVVGQRPGCRHDRHAGALGQRAGRHLVAKPLHHLRRRPDPHDPLGLARGRQVGVLGQEAVAGVDGVGPRVDAPRRTISSMPR